MAKIKSTKVFDVTKNVNPKFRSVWTSKKPYNVLKGGRNSFKSSVIALLLVFKMLKYVSIGETANVVIIRKVGNTLRDSVFLKIQWALSKFFARNKFICTVSPFKIRHKKTGSTFYFYGQDDFQKLKSNDIGKLIAVWYEEAAEFANAEEFDQTNTTFMRQKHPLADMVQFFWSYNPPRDSFAWINEWSETLKKSDDYMVHESCYLDDELGFVTDQMLAEIERIKNSNYDYYLYLYEGKPSKSTNYFFSDLKVNDADIDDTATYYLGVDSAYKGKDGIVVFLSCLEQSGELRLLDCTTIDKGEWVDGVTSEKIINEILQIIRRFNVKMVCVDVGYGVYLIEGLAKHADTFNIKGINFGSATTKQRRDAKHFAATSGANMRSELHISLQELMYSNSATFTSKAKKELEEQMCAIREVVKPNGKIGIIPKDELKVVIGKSPDELDAALLSVHAAILDMMVKGMFLYQDE